MKKRILLVFAVSVVLLPAVFASGSAEKKTTITYWTQDNEVYASVARELVEAFNKQSETIKVVHESFPDFVTKAQTSFAAGTEGDIIQMYGGVVGLAKAGKIMPVPESLYSTSEMESSFIPSSLTNRLYKGTYWGIPQEYNIESPAILINADMVKAEGFEIPASWEANGGPESWDELFRLARAMTIVEDGHVVQSGMATVNRQESSMFLSLIWQFGGDYRDPENMKVNFQIPAAKKSMQFMYDLVHAGEMQVDAYTSNGASDKFKQQTSPMIIGAPWVAADVFETFPDMDIRYYNLPPFVDGAEPNFVGEGGWGLVASKSCEHPEAAWEFIEFLTKEENMVKWAERVNSISSLQGVELNEDYLQKTSKILKYGKDPGAFTLNPVQLVWSIVRTNLRSCLNDEISIDQALQNMTEEANAMIEKNMK